MRLYTRCDDIAMDESTQVFYSYHLAYAGGVSGLRPLLVLICSFVVLFTAICLCYTNHMPKKVVVIYNPNSTGDALTNAQTFQSELTQIDRSIEIHLIPTEHAGHAREIAHFHADGTQTMIVSSSGDGGFHEVINGVLSSDHPDTIVGVLPSGNANDHYETRHRDNLYERIADGVVETNDVLTLRWDDHTVYAHSYIGLGISADVGDTLTTVDVNPVREIWLVISHLLRRRTIHIERQDRRERYSSVIYAVIERMSKYFDTGAADSRKPGEFVVIRTRARTLTGILSHIIRRVGQSDEPTASASYEQFTTLHKTKFQCDGEVVIVPAHRTVTISCLAGRLREII